MAPGISKSKIVYMALCAAILVSLYSHWMVFDKWIAPTYGNVGIHLATARHVIEHGEYPLNDYSYGGNVPSLYVPIFRVNLASIAMLTGLSLDLVARLTVLVMAILLPLGFFLLARRLFGDVAGAFAAFLSLLPAELLIYTVRPLPQGLGLVLLPIAFYLVLKENRIAALVAAFGVAWVHQEALLFYVAVVGAFGVVKGVEFLWKRRDAAKNAAVLALACAALATAAYLAWHFFMVGNIAVWELAQFKHHEGGVVSFEGIADKTGAVVTALSIVGLIFLAYGIFEKYKARKQAAKPATDFTTEEFALTALAVGLLLVKNDVLGVQVFMDRFIVYLNEAMIPVAALGAAKLVETALGISRRP
jgi:hypothetical protein